MTASTASPVTSRDTLHGILWMTVAMAGFATEDVFIKILSRTLPPGEILALLGLAGAVVFWGWAALRGLPVLSRDLLSGPILLRNAAEVVGTICFVTALALTSLINVSAILQATPLAVTLGAALFLGARVGWRRWTAIGAGFAGVLLILRPGLDAFQPASLLAVGTVIALSARDLATRVVPARIASEVLAAQSFVVVALAGLAVIPFGPPPVLPGAAEVAVLAAAMVTGTFAYYAITAAMRLGDITAITPFRYSRLLFALAFGILVLRERPDAATLAGAAIIVASGLYAFLRERRAVALSTGQTSR